MKRYPTHDFITYLNAQVLVLHKFTLRLSLNSDPKISGRVIAPFAVFDKPNKTLQVLLMVWDIGITLQFQCFLSYKANLQCQKCNRTRL